MKSIISTLLLTLTLLLNMPLSAAPYHQSDRHSGGHSERRFDSRTDHSDHRNSISRQQAADIAQREHPGRVLGVKRKERTYRVKTLNRRGELRETRINARNGKVVRRH